MMPPLGSKRLRFGYDIHPDESLVGAFGAACHDHRLRCVRSALTGGGLELSPAGGIQFVAGNDLNRVAIIMRMDADLVRAAAYVRTGLTVWLGDLDLPSTFIEQSRRRIAPLSLSDCGRHQAAWLNILLPYCPTSLERLVSECPTCGPLGWRFSRGVANCDRCGEPVPASGDPPLRPELAERYRDFADLVSQNAARNRGVEQRLPEALRPFSRSALVRLALRAGALLSSEVVGRGSKLRATDDAGRRADVVCTGMGVIADWPNSIQRYAEQRLATAGADLRLYERLRSDLRWLANSWSRETSDIVDLAFPSLDGRGSGVFASHDRYYSANQASSVLWCSSVQLRQLREAGAIHFEQLPSGQRIRARYLMEDVDQLRELLDASVTPSVAAAELDLPIYAIGQLVADGKLIVHDEVGLTVLRGGPQIDAASLRTLVADLRTRSASTSIASSAVPLRRAASLHPGEKPWAAIVDGMLDGSIPFWMSEEDRVRGALVERMTILGRRLERSLPDPLRVDSLSIVDTMEILGAHFEETIAALAEAGIVVEKRGKGNGVSRAAVRDLCRRVVFTGELAARTGEVPAHTYWNLRRANLPRVGKAWSRPALVAIGLATAIG